MDHNSTHGPGRLRLLVFLMALALLLMTGGTVLAARQATGDGGADAYAAGSLSGGRADPAAQKPGKGKPTNTREPKLPKVTRTATEVQTEEATETPEGCRASRDVELVSGLELVGDHVQATFRNRSNRCSYLVGVAAYKMFDDNIDNQELYDFSQATLGPRDTATLSALVPSCAWQADAFWGRVIRDFHGQRYGDRLLDDINGGGDFCEGHGTPTSTGTPEVTRTPRN